ncbi:MAG: hypothetical protein HQK50_06905 [Oligoflexia bacterium]|nr:hypothetical protein [Oligoflexia bacterium]
MSDRNFKNKTLGKNKKNAKRKKLIFFVKSFDSCSMKNSPLEKHAIVFYLEKRSKSREQLLALLQNIEIHPEIEILVIKEQSELTALLKQTSEFLIITSEIKQLLEAMESSQLRPKLWWAVVSKKISNKTEDFLRTKALEKIFLLEEVEKIFTEVKRYHNQLVNRLKRRRELRPIFDRYSDLKHLGNFLFESYRAHLSLYLFNDQEAVFENSYSRKISLFAGVRKHSAFYRSLIEEARFYQEEVLQKYAFVSQITHAAWVVEEGGGLAYDETPYYAANALVCPFPEGVALLHFVKGEVGRRGDLRMSFLVELILHYQQEFALQMAIYKRRVFLRFFSYHLEQMVSFCHRKYTRLLSFLRYCFCNKKR